MWCRKFRLRVHNFLDFQTDWCNFSNKKKKITFLIKNETPTVFSNRGWTRLVVRGRPNHNDSSNIIFKTPYTGCILTKKLEISLKRVAFGTPFFVTHRHSTQHTFYLQTTPILCILWVCIFRNIYFFWKTSE